MPYCSTCGKEIKNEDKFCPNCGSNTYKSNYANEIYSDKTQENVSDKSRMIAVLLAFFLGGLGIHRFYLGRTLGGILMLVFFWTGIPAIIALVDFIMLICGNGKDVYGRLVLNWDVK